MRTAPAPRVCGGSGRFRVSVRVQMIAFLIRRVIQALIVVLLVLLGVFLLTHVIPGGAARAALGPRATKVQIRQFNVINNYFKGIFVQFYLYLKGLIWHHNLGYSYKMNQGVTTVIFQRLPKTLVLVGISTALALIVAVPLGILQVVRRNKPIDHVLTGLTFVGYGMPSFLLGTLLILYFAIDIHIFSVEAPQGQTVGAILADPRGLVLPEIHAGRRHDRIVQPLHAVVHDGGDDRGLRPDRPG